MIIVSLTTIPPRFQYLYITIDSILNQTIQPDKIMIHIPKIYNNYSQDKLPEFSNDKIIINRQTKDYGPGTKLLGVYNTQLFNNMSNDDIIIVIDDDRIYNNKLIENMLNYHVLNKDKVLTICGWGTEALTRNCIVTSKNKQPRGVEFTKEGYVDVLGGCGGFLITKKNCPFNHKEIFEVDPKDANYYVDDILISGFITLNNTDIYLIPNTIRRDEERSINNGISALCDPTRIDKNTKCMQYFQNNHNIWNK